jgi:hypothetical protein
MQFPDEAGVTVRHPAFGGQVDGVRDRHCQGVDFVGGEYQPPSTGCQEIVAELVAVVLQPV